MEKSTGKFAERLRAALLNAGYEVRPAILEREFNLRWRGKPMTLHGVRRWLIGETIPGQDKLVVLAEWLGVTPQHLRYGAEIEKRIEDQRARWEHAIQVTERDVIEAYLKLPPTQRKAVREIILGLGQTTQKL
jgi:hypothetical protein